MGWAIDSNSFIRVYDYSRRKGLMIDRLFFKEELDDYVSVRNSIDQFFSVVLSGRKQYKTAFRKTVESICNNYIRSEDLDTIFANGTKRFQFDRKTIKKLKQYAVKQKNRIIYSRLSSLAANISNCGLDWQLDSTIRKRNGKDVYSLSKTSIESFFVCKVLQQSIKERCRIVMNNRNTIVKQVYELIMMNSPFSIIRTDITGFFESIPIDEMIRTIEDSNLPNSQVSYISDLLNKCSSTFNNLGLPRGIGLCSYLAELYLLAFDRAMKQINSVIYYNRYVDDIIVIVAEEKKDTIIKAEDVKKEMVLQMSKLGLKFHSEDKKDIIITKYSNRETEFDYLGYCFHFAENGITIDISESKIEKYYKRIDYAVWSYWNGKSYSVKKRNQLFADRIRFLSMRTRLNNNKGNVITGLPSRYSLIGKDSDSLKLLDDYLKKLCSKMPKSISCSVDGEKHISFRSGFSSEIVLGFSDSYLKEITSIWKSI